VDARYLELRIRAAYYPSCGIQANRWNEAILLARNEDHEALSTFNVAVTHVTHV